MVEQPEQKTEFTGKENYYVDKKPCNSYLSLETLNKNDSARYKVHFHQMGKLSAQQWRILRRRQKEPKRYFVKHKSNETETSDGIDPGEESSKSHRLSEEEFTAKTKMLNSSLMANPKDIDLWLELVRFQNHFYMKMNKVQLAERKMEILNKALRDNSSNDKLYHEYINIVEQAYPSFEVSKLLDLLIQKGTFICNLCLHLSLFSFIIFFD